MIARTWRGWTSAVDADRYVEYLRDTGVREYRDTPGNRGVFMLRRIVGDRAEFLLLTLWESMEAVRSFSGPDERVAVFYPEDDAFLVERDRHADHFEVLTAPEELQPGLSHGES
jgi:heme-degrading monooxygenase HmoA